VTIGGEGVFVKNCWYVAAWEHEVPASGCLARTIAGEPIVFWRDSRGEIVALLDRCRHRGAPLSMGRVEGDNIRCLYHGLAFDRSGTCVDIPSQDRIPPTAVVRSFPLVVAHRWVWIWMGEPGMADPSTIVPTPWLDSPAWGCKPDYLHYDVNYLLIADNLLDFSHLPFLHATSVGGSPDYAGVLPKVERIDRGVRLTKWVLNTTPPAYSAKYGATDADGKVDRWMFYDFVAPGILIMDSGMRPAGSADDAPGRIAFRGCQALTPETADTTHYFFAHCHDFGLDDPSVTTEIHNGILTAFEEDRLMISAQHRNLALDPDFRMMPLAVDAALQQFRWTIGQLLKAEQPANGSADPAAVGGE
jgi:phenylpropionate dioxygenase-like ring-hydroxylating dioxygenase large terminal subunit